MFSSTDSYLIALAAAFLVGVSKTGLPGVGIVLAPAMAMSVPAKDSVGLLVLLLIVGDLFALLYYRRHADWILLKRLLPYVFIGIFSGSFLLAQLDHQATKQMIGALIIALLIVEIARRHVKLAKLGSRRALQVGVGILAGFCTVLGNAAGPLMAIYFVLLGLKKSEFMGTAAWFFFIVNVSKVPIYIFIDVLRVESFTSAASLVPAVIVGAIIGFYLLKLISQRVFDGLILMLTALAALWLIVS